MESLLVKQMESVSHEGIAKLVKESEQSGFRFLQRLVNDYSNGTNTFNKMGEAFYGVFNDSGGLIAVGGINQDPFSTEQSIGRLRRFYVQKVYRRHGVGRLLVNKIIQEAGNHFDIIVLKTDTEQAAFFYQSLGFIKSERFSNATHYYIIKE